MIALSEPERLTLMQAAGCELLRCGLTLSRPRDGGLPTLTHHRRSKAVGKAVTTEAVRTVEPTDSDAELVAWIREQHGE